jgi:hypothetical protein
MKSLDNIAEDLFNKIRGRFPSVTIGDEAGKVINDPLAARFFDFDFKEGDRNLGKVSISISEDALAVMYSNNFVENEDAVTKSRWFDFLKELRTFAKKRLLSFDTRDITKSNLNKRDYKFLAQQQGGDAMMSESKMYGTSRVSYQNIGNARLNIRHTENVNQEVPGSRAQKIGAIYIESADGERFKYPYKHLSGARAMAQHVSEGGKPFDDFGKHITGLSEELNKLRKFKTYMGRSAVMAESLSEYMDVVKERITTVKKTIESLQKPTFYKEALDSYEVPVLEDVPEDVAENWIDQLTIRQFNEELKDVFPYIYKLVSEASKAEEVTPENLEEFDIMNPIDSVKKWHKGRMDKYEAELNAVRQMAQKIDKNGALDAEATCNADPVDCLKQFIADNGGNVDEAHGNDSMYDRCWDGYERVPGTKRGEDGSCRKKTSEDAIEAAVESLMGQFAESEDDTDEGNKFTAALAKAKANDDDEMDVDGKKIPVTEFILSLFDRETGQFPKGETAVLTAVEKDYGDQYINPAKEFISRIQETYKTYSEQYNDEESISELGAGGIGSMAIANSEAGDKIAKFFGDAGHAEYGLINLLRKAVIKFGPSVMDKMGLTPEEQEEMLSKLKSDLESNEVEELDRVRNLAGLR